MSLNSNKETVEQFDCFTCICNKCTDQQCDDCIWCDGHHPIEGCKKFQPPKNEEECISGNMFIETVNDIINHPLHYVDGRKYEPIDVILDWDLGFCLGNTIKYISRAGRKNKDKKVEDLEKAKWYIDRAIKEFKR